MDTQHTPGPCTVRGPSPAAHIPVQRDPGGDYAIVDAKGKIIGEAYAQVGKNDFAPAAANARLWATACNCHDDLLAACESFIRGLEHSAAPVNMIAALQELGKTAVTFKASDLLLMVEPMLTAIALAKPK